MSWASCVSALPSSASKSKLTYDCNSSAHLCAAEIMHLFIKFFAFLSYFRKKCRQFYTDHSYEEAKHRYYDSHSLYYGAHKTPVGSEALVEHIEMTPGAASQAPDHSTHCSHRQYGTMALLSYKPSGHACSVHQQQQQLQQPPDHDVTVSSVRRLSTHTEQISNTNNSNETKELLLFQT